MDTSDLPAPQGERHILNAEEELRLEVAFQKQSTCQIIVLKGSCELQGVELATNKPYQFTDGGFKLALFTWHGCVVDVKCEESLLEISYTSDETACNIAFVNTHAQLEALRDEAAASGGEGPRVLICGPSESGKSSLTKTLIAYATKLGRVPLWMDLDPADNALSVPGTLAVCPMDRQAVQVESFATTGIPQGTAAPLVLWHGNTDMSPDLFRAQVSALGKKIDARLQTDDWARSSGIIVNTNGWIEDEGYQLLLHTTTALRISVVLVLGHDRLYSMMKSALKKLDESIKVIKIPRSGGVVSRGKEFIRQHRSRSVKRYFYGDNIETAAQTSAAQSSSSAPTRVPQLTPYLAQIKFDQITVYKFASMSLSASLLPVAAAQTTESVQLVEVSDLASLQHKVVAVCHPQAVAAYQATKKAKELYESGVAGFCVVERVISDTEMLHLLSPCAGSLPSYTLLVGDLTWME